MNLTNDLFIASSSNDKSLCDQGGVDPSETFQQHKLEELYPTSSTTSNPRWPRRICFNEEEALTQTERKGGDVDDDRDGDNTNEGKSTSGVRCGRRQKSIRLSYFSMILGNYSTLCYALFSEMSECPPFHVPRFTYF